MNSRKNISISEAVYKELLKIKKEMEREKGYRLTFTIVIDELIKSYKRKL